MAIQWGSWDYGSGNGGFRVGIDVDISDVDTGDSSVTFTYRVYVENQYNVDDEMTLSFSGNASGTASDVTFDNDSNTYNYVALRATKTHVYSYSTYGSSPGTRTFTASLSGAFNGANPSKTVTNSIPARPYAGPTQPSGVTATRNSDTQATIAWTRVVTAQRPYSSQTVQMRIYSRSSWGPWATVATTSATATSYVKTGLSANLGYQFQVRSNNSAGSSNFVAATAIYMTPASPSPVSSVLAPTGTSIETFWTSRSFTSPNITFTVQRSVNGAAYATVVSGLDDAATSWSDPAPGAGTNRYRVAAVHQSLTSAYVEGNTITTIVAPLAPTLLTPNGAAVDFTLPVVFSWQHNHGGDAAAQSHYTLEISSNSGASWSALATDVASTTSSRTIAAGTLSNGTPYQWRVKTEGIVSGGYGPFSASATVTGSSTPTVTITAPTATQNTLPVVVAWDYNQDQGSPQSSWEVTLYAADGTTILESLTDTGTDEAVAITYPLVDQSSYVVKVRARSGAGLWSTVQSRSITFALLPPAAVLIAPEYQPETGTAILALAAAVAVPGSTVAVESATVERRVNGGSWTVLATDVPVPTEFLDVLPVTNGVNEYRATSVSASPSYFVGSIVQLVPENPYTPEAPGGIQWVFLNYGPGFQQLLRFRSEPKISESSGRAKALHAYLGRSRPVPSFGEDVERNVAVAGKLVFDSTGLGLEEKLWDSPPADWSFAARVADVVCFRDYSGRRIFGTLSNVDAADELPGLGSVSFSVSEIDYAEPGGYIDPETIPDGGSPSSFSEFIIDGGAP